MLRGCELSQNLHFCLRLLWLDLFSFFLIILSISAVDWDLIILRACLRVSSATWSALIALDRVKSPSRRGLSWRDLSLIQNTIIYLIKECWRLLSSQSELNSFNSVTKLWKFWPFVAQIFELLPLMPGGPFLETLHPLTHYSLVLLFYTPWKH